MAQNFQKGFIFMILCIVLIFISGLLLLPRYLSEQYFQLRHELDSENGNFKYSEQENLKHSETSLNSPNRSQDSITTGGDIKAENAQDDSSDTVISPSNARAKVKKRSKRQALSNTDKFVAWNFSLNLLSQQDSDSHESVEPVPNALDQNNFMGVSVNAKGKGKQHTALAELQNALSAVKQFVNSFIFKPRQNVTSENAFSPDKVVFDIESEVQTQNPDIVKFESDESGDEPVSPRRQPKFIFGMFGFGKKSIESTTNFEGETTEVRRDSDIGVLKVPEVLLESKHTPKAENDLEILNLQPESLIIQANNSEEMVNTESSLAVMTERKCSDNGTTGCESFAHKSKTDIQEETPEAASPTKPLFTDNVLELFCMSLVNKVAESQHLFDSDEGNALDSQHKTEKENQLQSLQNSSFLNLLNVFNSTQKNEFAPVTDVIEDFVTESNDELMTDIELSKRKESRFLNFGGMFGFGSGRSAISDESNSLENAENEDMIQLENLPSLLDCESYFRKKQNIKMFPKPNLMDMISDPKIELVDFANATISSKLQEQNLQFLTDLLKNNLNNTVDSFSKISGDTDVANFKSESNFTSNKSALNDVDASEILNATESSDSHLSKPISTSTSAQEDQHSTESQRAGKFINFFDFGSGFFGSGMRSLETYDSTETGDIEEFGSGEQFRKTDVQVQNVSENVPQERSFGFLGFGGSGDGRELAEDEKTTETTETEMPCDEDCMQLIVEKSTDFDDDECNVENPLEDNGVEQFEGAASRNESNCDEDCLTNYTISNSKTDNTVENVLEGRILHESTYLEHLNCSCYHDTTDGNITFTECDECSFEDVQRKGESHASLGQPSVLLRNESEVKFRDDYENGCDDCNTEEKLLDKNMSISKNTSFPECDECSFNSISTPKHESAENVENNAHARNITFQECDECSFSTLDEQEMNEDTKNLSNIDILSKDTSMTKSHDYETDCHDCNAHMEQSNETIPYLDNESDAHTRLVNLDSNDRLNFNKSADLDNTIGEVESFTDANQIQDSVAEQTTKMQHPRFMGTIFLTGSGDGGLFGDSVGPINLIQEESTVAPPEFSRKRGRSDDTLTYPTEMLSESDLEKMNQDFSKDTTEVAQISTSTPLNFRSSRKGRLDDVWIDSFDILNETNHGDINIPKPETDRTPEEIATVSDDFSQRTGRLDDVNFDPCDDCDTDLNQIMNERNLRNSSSSYEDASITSKTNNFEVREKFSSTIPPESKTDIINSTKITEQATLHTFTSGIPVLTNLPPRFCSSASECNSTLNERCITVNSSPICTCGRAFVRHKETRKCVVKRIVKTSMKLPGEKFDEDLKDPSSQRYKEMKKYATDWMSSLLRNMPNLWPVLSHVEVLKFRPGSLIVDWNIVFAVENESEEMLVKDVSSSFQKALQNESLRQEGPLNVSYASLISVNSVNPCKADEMNECYCEWKAVSEGFICHCSEQFRDFSSHSHHIDESCQESCSPDYCSFNGHCEIINDKRICLCSGLYFGQRCEVPGLFILIILAVIALISVALLLIVIFARKCRTRSYGGPQTFRRSQEVGSTISQTHDRVSDTIAMEENIGATVSKFKPITTPTRPPLIKVIRPTISASITSFEADCQFDDSPLSDATSRNATSTV